VPFDEGTLKALYPSHSAYVSEFNDWVKEDLKAGFIVKEDAYKMMNEAANSDIP
jgi:hypothetical protein